MVNVKRFQGFQGGSTGGSVTFLELQGVLWRFQRCTWGSMEISESFQEDSEDFRAGFRDVTEALHSRFRGVQRDLSTLHGVRGRFRGVSEAFQEGSEDFRQM